MRMYDEYDLAANVPFEFGLAPFNNRYQFDFTGTTGSVNIEIDAGGGYRIYETVDLTVTTRLPYSIEIEAKSVQVTPTDNIKMTVCANRI